MFLKAHLAEVGKSYKEVTQELLDENIYPEPFVIIAAVRMFLYIPVLVIKPKIAEINTTQKRKVTHWEATEWFCTESDASLDKSYFQIFLVFNGIKFFAPAVYTHRVHLHRAVTHFRESLDKTMELAKEIINIVPPSEFFNAYNIIMKSLDAADSLSTQAHVATGTATIDLPEESLAPRIHPTGASTMRKRPEGAAGHLEGEDNIPKKKYKSTKLGPNQCPCGVQCTDRDNLNNHIEKVHSPEHWACSYLACPKFYNTRGAIWKHYRVKHLKAFNWQCPEVNCDWGHEEESALKKHMVEDHGGESNIMCPQCKHVFSQKKNTLKQHIEIC